MKGDLPPAQRPGRGRHKNRLLQILPAAAVVALSIYIFSIREHIEAFGALGYPGIFIIALLANATVLLPAPGLAAVFTLGAVLNPVGVGLAAGSGAAIGELSGYLAGLGGRAVVENAALYGRIRPTVQKWGGPGIFLLAAIPNPFFDLVGIAAGALKMPLGKFFVYCWLGQLLKMSAVAYAGSHSVNWFFE